MTSSCLLPTTTIRSGAVLQVILMQGFEKDMAHQSLVPCYPATDPHHVQYAASFLEVLLERWVSIRSSVLPYLSLLVVFLHVITSFVRLPYLLDASMLVINRKLCVRPIPGVYLPTPQSAD